MIANEIMVKIFPNFRGLLELKIEFFLAGLNLVYPSYAVLKIYHEYPTMGKIRENEELVFSITHFLTV